MPDLSLLHAILLGLVEGITEFLPISSTGHLIVVGEWLGFVGERAKVFEVFIQLGAILAVLWHYRSTFAAVAVRWPRDPAARAFVLNLVLAFLPAAIVGLLAHDWIKAELFSPRTVAYALVAGGVAILAVERWRPPPRVEDAQTVAPLTALGIGLAQVLALFPGVSRSGATIMGGIGLGLSRPAATEFSFFLAVPVMIAATLFDLLGSLSLLSVRDVPVFAVGLAVAFVSALVVIRAFLAFVSRRSFAAFAWYRIAFGVLLLATIAR